MRIATLAVLAITVACAGGDEARRAEPPPPPRRALVRREPLPELARELLKKRMGRHGKDLERLTAAAVALDYDDAAASADAIAHEPRISRPEAMLDTANSLFPERFFELQDVLLVEAAALGAAARARDAEETSAAYGRLSATCVACHAVYAEAP